MRQRWLVLAADRVHSKKKYIEKKENEKSAPPKTHHEIHSACSPATATTSRRRAMKHVPRVRPHSLPSTDPGFVEIGLVQLSQSVKSTNVTFRGGLLVTRRAFPVGGLQAGKRGQGRVNPEKHAFLRIAGNSCYGRPQSYLVLGFSGARVVSRASEGKRQPRSTTVFWLGSSTRW